MVILICSLTVLLFYSCTFQTKVTHSLRDLSVLYLDIHFLVIGAVTGRLFKL